MSSIKIVQCGNKKDIEEGLWSCIARAGYNEISLPIIYNNSVRKNLSESMASVDTSDAVRCCSVGVSLLNEIEKESFCFGIIGSNNLRAIAEITALCMEAIQEIEINDFILKFNCYGGESEKLFGSNDILSKINDDSLRTELSKLYDYLYMYGLSEFLRFDINPEYKNSESFNLISGDIILGEGCKINNSVVFEYDIDKTEKFLEDSQIGTGRVEPEKTLIFAENDADGIAYDVTFSIRQCGCLGIMYIGDGNYAEAEKYAKKTGAASMMRVYPNGKIDIKDFISGEITETDSKILLGYFNDNTEEEQYECHDDGCDCHDDDCHCHDHKHN